MKGALGKKELLAVVPVSMSTIDRMEKNGEFPKRFWITDKRCARNSEEIERWLDERQQNGTTEFAGKSLRLSSEYFARLVTRRDVAGEVLGKVVRMVSVPPPYPPGCSCWRSFFERVGYDESDGKIPRGLCLAAQSAPSCRRNAGGNGDRAARYCSREKGQYRLAARLWLECMDAATGEVERARIAIRRDQCIGRGNRLRQDAMPGSAPPPG